MIPGWREENQQGYLDFLHRHRRAAPPEVAAQLNISECCAVYWLTDLARDGKVRILAVEPVEEGTLPCTAQGALACQGKVLCPFHAEAQLAREGPVAAPDSARA